MGKIIKNISKLTSKIIYRFTKEGKEINRIKKIPRYSQANTFIFGYEFKFVDSASFCAMYEGIFKKQIYKFKVDKTDPYIVDCGSNIGLSVLYFKKLYPEAEILAFEPDPEIFKILEFNLRSFSDNNVNLIQKAVWNRKGEMLFHSRGADEGHLITTSSKIKREVQKIRTITLEKYLQKEVDLLKIDIEGAETEVILNIANFLFNVNRIYVEYHSFKNSKQNLDLLLKVLSEQGFRYFVENTTVTNQTPFMNINTYQGFDNLLNIYAYR